MGALGMTTNKTVTAGGMSNLHPSMSVPFQSKDVGQHVCAALDRFTVVTARPVQPHSPLPTSLALPSEDSRWAWLPVPRDHASELGLAVFFESSPQDLEGMKAISQREEQ